MESLEKTKSVTLQNAKTLISELTSLLGLKKFADIETLIDTQKKELWKKAATEMQPHINGTMPDTINKSFPYEGSDVLAYRLNVYNSVTAPLLKKAVIGVQSRVLEKISYEANEKILEYLKVPRFKAGFDFEGFMRQFYYPMRVKDPNAILAVRKEPAVDRTQDPILDLVIHASANIIYQSEDLVIVKVEPEKESVAAYYCYAKNSQALIHVLPNGEAKVTEFQDNDNNLLPLCFLGGRSNSKTIQSGTSYSQIGTAIHQSTDKEAYFYASDFSYALPLMNKCETLSSQSNISSLKAAIPITVQRELQCGTCKGEGEIIETDAQGGYLYLPDSQIPKRKSCPTCNGAGSITPLKTNEVIIPHSIDAFGADKAAQISDIAKNIIGYVSPSTENAKFISDEAEKAEKKVQDALNLDYTNLNFAISAESKKEARAEKETLLGEIAGGIKRVYEHILKVFTSFLSYRNDLRADMLSVVKVILPTQFITVGANELEIAYLENKINLSLQQRDASQRQIEKNKNPSQTDKINLYYNIAWRATNGLWLATAVELNEINLLGTLSNEDKIRAIKAASYIYDLIFIEGLMDKNAIVSQTNEFMQAELAKTQPLNLPPLGNADSTQP